MKRTRIIELQRDLPVHRTQWSERSEPLAELLAAHMQLDAAGAVHPTETVAVRIGMLGKELTRARTELARLRKWVG